MQTTPYAFAKSPIYEYISTSPLIKSVFVKSPICVCKEPYICMQRALHMNTSVQVLLSKACLHVTQLDTLMHECGCDAQDSDEFVTESG